jgi:hypothetical protein
MEKCMTLIVIAAASQSTCFIYNFLANKLLISLNYEEVIFPFWWMYATYLTVAFMGTLTHWAGHHHWSKRWFRAHTIGWSKKYFFMIPRISNFYI